MARWKRDDEVKTAIVRTLREKGPLGYNLLFEEVQQRTRCGRNQFARYLTELRNESAIIHKKSPTHKRGVILELGENASRYIQGKHFYFFADALISALLPFAELRGTGSIEEQLAQYDLQKLLPFRIKVELTSEAQGRHKVVAEATINKDGLLQDSKIDVF